MQPTAYFRIVPVTTIAVAMMTCAISRGAGFSFANFSSTSGLTLVHDTAQFGNRLRLTPPVDSRWGAAWYTQTQPVAAGFTTTFQFQITEIEPGDIGADGFAFLVQNDAVDALAAGGEDIGYGNFYLTGIRNSLAIEFDMHENDTQNDPNSNHISVQSRGTLENSAHTSNSLGLIIPPFNMKDGTIHTVNVQYVPGQLRLSLDAAPTPNLVVPVNLSTLLSLNQGQAWVGFTASAGGTHEAHDILSWSFVAVPEPGSTCLFVSAAVTIGGFAIARRRIAVTAD
jgi:hypothetical protein